MKLNIPALGVAAFALLSFVGAMPTAAQKVDKSQNLLKETAEKPAVQIGEEVKRFSFKDVSGRAHYLDDLLTGGPVVFVFTSAECPLAQRYTLRLNRLQKNFSTKGASFFGVYSNEEATPKSISQHAKEMGITFPVVKDYHGFLARALGATMTPQVFVIGRGRILRYRGAIDDNRYVNRVRKHFLQDGLMAIVSGKTVEVSQTDCHGCTLHLPTAETVQTVTYTRHIARIIQNNCVACHRPGEVGPFSLIGYKRARTWAKEIKAYTHARVMPPWKAAPGFGEFKNDMRLRQDEIDLIARWVEQGTPIGDKADLPPPPRFHKEWALGKPDMIIEMPEVYTVGPEGEDDYRHFIIPTNLPRDVYVEAIDVRPGNRKVVHHVIAYTDTSGKARKLDKTDPGPGYTRFGDVGFKPASVLGGWAPGMRPNIAPKGTGFWFPKGADVVLQVHYYRSGKVEKDRTKVGLYFSKSPKPVRIHAGMAINRKFVLKPGAKRQEVKAEWKLKHNVFAIGTTPHMHLLGKEMKVIATLPDGEVLPLIWIKNWDFNWQLGYRFKKPLYFPKGTSVKLVAYFDNSAGNPNNPNSPPKEVRWGERTTDEMCIAFVSVVSAAKYAPLLNGNR